MNINLLALFIMVQQYVEKSLDARQSHEMANRLVVGHAHSDFDGMSEWIKYYNQITEQNVRLNSNLIKI